MLRKSEALVLQVSETGENDRLITVLSKEYGVFRAFAKGARKPTSRLQSYSQTFCYANYEFAQHKDSWIVRDASAIAHFFGLRDNCARLALAGYFCELAKTMSPQDEPAADHLRLILNALHFLCEGTRDHVLLKSIVELRLLCLMGYMPDLDGCAVCGAEKSALQAWRFDCVQGVLFCSNCAPPQNKQILFMREQERQAIQTICEPSLAASFAVRLPNETLSALGKTSETFLHAQLGRSFTTLKFYRSCVFFDCP
jgi:DNA repair protein RecO (recombination protein O)